ncbi:MAG: Asp-tRNA(Asn)/Glu-tRNA(Gln) amidotransferase subunit GatA [Firmicutes bacterium]|nr:Asp-tRNA(Asn)/Glu-tRNA(Gln) amidotransferase subunit GatA [Bacillota bacterium]
MDKILTNTATELSKKLESGEITSVQLVAKYLEHIEEIEPTIKAFITITKEQALRDAQASDQRRKEGKPLSKWDGIPIALKDNLSTKGVKTTCGSLMLENYIPPYDATVVERLKNNGLIILGKTNMDEFAMGSSTESSAFYPTRNPKNISKVPGGSSGGSAACVAAYEVPWALGTDTGGSVRGPASFCGVIGLKPTYGSVSRYGVVSYASSLDQVGWFTRSVGDAAALFQLISGYDPKDSTSVKVEDISSLESSVTGGVEGLTIGVIKECFGEELNPQVCRSVRASVEKLKEAGANIVEISLPFADIAIETYYIISTAEASSNLARFDGVRYGLRVPAEDVVSMFTKTRSQGFGEEVKRRIILGTHVLSAGNYDKYYRKAQKIRTAMKKEFTKVFEQVDLLITPTTPTTAFGFGEKQDPLHMYITDIYTVIVNLIGAPAISLPCGLDKESMPIGLQIIGKHFDEKTLLQAAHTLENLLDQEVEM